MEFHHVANLAYIDPEPDLDHLCTPSDIPSIIAALNQHLEHEGSRHRISNMPRQLSRRQTHSLLSIASELITWSGSRPVDTGRIDENGGLEKVISQFHPELAPCSNPSPDHRPSPGHTRPEGPAKPPRIHLTILSLGLGIQSTTMALLLERDMIPGVPKPDHAIFADTKAEPKHVYDTLEWLRHKVSIPISTCSFGDIAATPGRPSPASPCPSAATTPPAT